MQPDPSELVQIAGIEYPLIGFYDAPDPQAFNPLVQPKPGRRVCVFSFFQSWQKGSTLHLTGDNVGCRGAGNWLFDIPMLSRQDFVRFLADDEGLKASHALMNQWLDHQQPYQQEHPHILIGPLAADQYAYLKSVTFFANPDQISLLMLGAQYNAAPDGPAPVLAPFGSGCMQLVTLFDSLDIPQALVGATDIAMRQHLPPDILALTVTNPMFEQLCALDQNSFLHKPFWQRLQKARAQ